MNERVLHPAQMGLEPLPLADWLKPRAGDDALLAERARIIAAHRTGVIAARPEAESAVKELAALLRARGFEIAADAGDLALSAIGHAVAEDLCVLTKTNAGYRLTAGILCFPNRWRLTDKIGGDLVAVHGPVPDYAHEISAGVDRFLLRLRPERPFKRGNWGLASSPALYLPAPVAPVDFDDAEFTHDAGVFLRREEQSFLKLPESEAVIFAIRTAVLPWRETPENLRSSIVKMTAELGPAWLAYKSVRRTR